MNIVIVCYPFCDVIDFEIYISFLIKPFYGEMKNTTHHFKEFSLKQIKPTLLEDESPTLSKISKHQGTITETKAYLQ